MINKKSKSNSPKSQSGFAGIIVLAVFGIIMLMGASGIAGYLLYKKVNSQKIAEQPINQEVESNPRPELPVVNNEGVQVQQNLQQAETATEPSAVEQDAPEKRLVDDEISWNEPQEIKSLNLIESWEDLNGEKFNKKDINESGAKYYKVGRFLNGKYKDGEIILLRFEIQGMGSEYNFYRFVRQDDKTTLLKNDSTPYNKIVFIKSKFNIDEVYKISSLESPVLIQGQEGRQVLQLDNNDWINELFDSTGLEKVFINKNFDNIYIETSFIESVNYMFHRNGFYLRLPDGTAKFYFLKVDFIGENSVPEITWSDGVKNDNQYMYTDVGGCGSRNYISVMSKKDIDIANDLKETGKNSKDDVIYEFKDKNNSFLKNYYDKEYGLGRDVKPSSYEEFTAKHPIFFWVDPFGRLIKFQNNEFLPAVECGKPVIYLYPKETINVSVKVEPKGGLSYSDPDYKNGWFVKAEPNGNLTEISSGKNYPYLFWEGRGGIYETPKKGFSVKEENVHNFLIEKLALLGLNKKETDDFLEFWEPRMKGSPYYFVTFLGTRGMDKLAPLTIDPKPDTIIRILMDFVPLDNPIKTEEFKITTPKRNGFTVVEWGGVLR